MLHFLFLPLREVFFSLPPVDTNILLLDTSLFALKQEDILRCICKYWNLIYWFSKQGCSSSTKQHSEFFNYIIFSLISKPKDEIRRIKSIRKIVTKKVNLMSSIAMFLYIHCVPQGGGRMCVLHSAQKCRPVPGTCSQLLGPVWDWHGRFGPWGVLGPLISSVVLETAGSYVFSEACIPMLPYSLPKTSLKGFACIYPQRVEELCSSSRLVCQFWTCSLSVHFNFLLWKTSSINKVNRKG